MTTNDHITAIAYLINIIDNSSYRNNNGLLITDLAYMEIKEHLYELSKEVTS